MNTPLDTQLAKQTKILIVEDSATQAARLQYVLQQHDYDVTIATNGGQALKLVAEMTPNVVISDIIMPEMDGYELCQHLRQNPNYKHLPIILLTTLAETEDVVRGLHSGANYFITKPYEEEYLIKCVKNILRTQAIRLVEPSQEQIRILINGKEHIVQADKTQILDLLVSTYEAAIQKNQQLISRNQQLLELNQFLEEKERKLDLALQSSGTATWSWDCLNDHVEWDHYLHNIFGFKATDTVPHKLEDFFQLLQDGDRERVREAITEALTKTNKYSTEFRQIWPDGSEHYITTQGMIFTDQAGRPTKMTGVCIDITEQVKNKNELLRLHDELKVQQEIVALNERLKNSNDHLQEFVNVASHDIQEPLRMVGRYVELLQMQYGNKLDDAAQEIMSEAIQGVSRIKLLINDLLEYSQVEMQDKKFHLTNMKNSLSWALSNLQLSIEETQTKIIVDNDEWPEVYGDATLLGQLWQNLIGNAIRYRTTDKHPEIHVGIIVKPNYWEFYAKDNGIGIDPKYHKKIFKIFNRVSEKREDSGTGIGLAICKKIIERHQGKIWVESNPGEGANFIFILPKIAEVIVYDETH
jgi:PAS domain S-box-containing protein